MEYNKERVISNSIKLLKEHCPNLVKIIETDLIVEFMERSFIFIEKNKGQTKGYNFLALIFDLARQHKTGKGNLIEEFKYFNFLLGKFHEIEPNSKEFRSLLKSTLFNFKTNNFHNVLAECAVLLNLSANNKFIQYEYRLDNGKQIDLVIQDINTKEVFYIDVHTIHFDHLRYVDSEKFEKLIIDRVEKKFNDKTKGLEKQLKNQIIIFPVISGLNDDIIIKNIEFLKTFIGEYNTKSDIGFNSIIPHFFAKYGNEYFGLINAEKFENDTT